MAKRIELNLSAPEREKLKRLIRSGQIFFPGRTRLKKRRVAPFRVEQVEIYGEDTSNIGSVRRTYLP